MSCRFDFRRLPAPVFDPPQSEGGECGLISLWRTEGGNRVCCESVSTRSGPRGHLRPLYSSAI